MSESTVNRSDVIPTTGLEYVMVPDGTQAGGTYEGSQSPYSWSSTNISYASCVPLSGFRILTRYRTVATIITPAVPPTGVPGDPNYNPGSPETTTYSVSYPGWTLVSQTLTSTSHADVTPGNPFQQDNPYFTATAGGYGPYASPATAGIVDDSCYDYFKVFDQSASGYIEALSTYTSEPIEDSYIPTAPYDEDATPPLYPIDALTEFVPDTRESVTVTYQLTTVYNTGGSDVSSSVSFSHTVTQSTDDWSAQVQSLVERSYYYHGIFPSMPDPRDPPLPIDGTNSDGSHFYP
ncbi:hypothetical protein [Synechococcus phage S-H34]|uniref:Uncharacterized protein n=1 Tax=Synechococcus phage S-H34 TaxID=2718942 RepID=A0A6G8R6N8_9CAUD|nr:hypothetical protein PQC15_gp192 [Synechococcus phage S-H34]QIN97063.1 hypothetical protein [Synechococcus phage S-H34]